MTNQKRRFLIIIEYPIFLFFLRWITSASCILRLYAQTKNPSKWLVKMVGYILNIYAPALFTIRKSPNITNGSRHLFNMIQLACKCCMYSHLPNKWGGSNNRGGWKVSKMGRVKMHLINRESGHFPKQGGRKCSQL